MENTLTGSLRLHKALESRFLEGSRDVIVYLPPAYNLNDRRYPVLYLHDAQRRLKQQLFVDLEHFVAGECVQQAAQGLSVVTVFFETGPFDFMNIEWYYEPVQGGVKMRWVQEFHMKPTAPVNDDWMENNINTNTKKQMAIIKERVEKRHAGKA